MRKLLMLLMVLSALLTGCGSQPVYEKEIFCMDTVMSVKVWGADGEQAMEECRETLNLLQSTWSATDPDSLLSRLNRGEEAQLTQQQEALLERILALSGRTKGAFDPQLGALCRAWGFYGQEYRVPSSEELSQAQRQSQWDLGAAIKGYAGQQLAEMLESRGIGQAILNLGGNVQTVGQKADGSPWQVAVQNPNVAEDYVGILSVSGTVSVVTSGDYQRFFEADGVTYHHILDPQTGYPARSGLSSVTVICRDGLTADVLSTALFVMGLEEGITFWRGSDDFEAVFILEDGSVFATEGASLSGCQYEVISREN